MKFDKIEWATLSYSPLLMTLTTCLVIGGVLVLFLALQNHALNKRVMEIYVEMADALRESEQERLEAVQAAHEVQQELQSEKARAMNLLRHIKVLNDEIEMRDQEKDRMAQQIETQSQALEVLARKLKRLEQMMGPNHQGNAVARMGAASMRSACDDGDDPATVHMVVPMPAQPALRVLEVAPALKKSVRAA